MKHYYRIITAVLVLFLGGCSFAEQEEGARQLIIASWNVQNLFDGSDNGFEYAEFKNSAGWNVEKYQARLNGISNALNGENGVKPHILTLIEVENEAVVRELAENYFPDYRWTFFAGSSSGSVGMGILSALPLTETRVHSFHSPDGGIPRPVAEVWADTGSGPLVLLACHWKSKLEGDSKTEAIRRAGAALVVRRLAEIEAESPGTPVIILGDLNENHDEFERIGGAYLCALISDTDEAAALINKTSAGPRPGSREFLVVSGQKPPHADSFTGTTTAVYSPWMETETPYQGSYYYKDAWETIDHFLLNAPLFSGQGWNYEQFRVLTGPPFTDSEGIPQPYNLRSGNGLSDHLPIVLYLYKP